MKCIDEPTAVGDVRLHEVAFAPFVPRLEEEDLAVGWLFLDSIKGHLHVLLEILGSGMNEERTVPTAAGGVIPLGDDGGEDIVGTVLLGDEVRISLAVVSHLCGAMDEETLDVTPHSDDTTLRTAMGERAAEALEGHRIETTLEHALLSDFTVDDVGHQE